MSTITCPISAERVNENVVRFIAAFVILITIVALTFQSYSILFLLAFDFYERAFFKGNGSFLKFAAKLVSAKFSLPVKLVDEAPKKFAALLGLIFCISIAVSILLGALTLAYVLGGLLIICALLESAIGFCVGCLLYTFLVAPFSK